MALTNEDFFELRDLLDTLYREQASDVEVSTMKDKALQLRSAPPITGLSSTGLKICLAYSGG